MIGTRIKRLNLLAFMVLMSIVLRVDSAADIDGNIGTWKNCNSSLLAQASSDCCSPGIGTCGCQNGVIICCNNTYSSCRC